MNDFLAGWRHSSWLPYLLSAIFASMLFLNLRSFTSQSVGSVADDSVVSQEPAAEENTDIAHSMQYPVFGVYVPDGQGTEAIQPSTLDLKIVGIVYSSTLEKSEVLAEMGDGIQKIFHVGDILPGDARIKRITHDGLLIWYNNHLERIELPRDTLTFLPGATPMAQDSS